MKPRTNPSYLFLSRHGIYYFRCRIPQAYKKLYNVSKNEVRKSLHTSNYTEALKKARKLWVDMTDQNKIFEIYQQIEEHDDMLKRGRELYQELKEIRNSPEFLPSDEEEFKFTLKSEYDWKCLEIAKEYFDSREPIQDSLPCKKEDYRSVLSLAENNKELTTNYRSVPNTNTNKITISEAVNKYYQWYINDIIENKQKNVPEKTRTDKKRTLKTFSIIIGEDLLLNDLNHTKIEEYVRTATNIPKRLNCLYPNPPNRTNVEILKDHFDEIVEIGITQDREKKSNDTLNREFTTIKMFLRWAEERNYTTKGLGNFIPSMKERNKKTTGDPSFTENDLTLLFNSKQYIQGTFKKPSDYWMPLLGLFTGARGNELAYLFKEDIRKHPDCNIWYIYIRENLEIHKRVKNHNSIRSIPIHPQLKKLGFLKYVETLPDGSRLFPELKEDLRNPGDYYKKWGNNFNRHEIEKRGGKLIINRGNGKVRIRRGYMTQCGVEKNVQTETGNAVKSFKSFRHMMVNFLDKHTNPRTKNFIIGHKQQNHSVQNYIHPDAEDLQQAYNVLKKLKFSSIDWSKIKKMEWRSSQTT